MTSYVAKGKAAQTNPYDLNFKELRENYMDSMSKKLKFWKSSFVHYCKNPYVYAEEYGGSDTLLTMELCQAPDGLKYTNLYTEQEIKSKGLQEQYDNMTSSEEEDHVEGDSYGSSNDDDEDQGYGVEADEEEEDEEDPQPGEDRIYKDDMFNFKANDEECKVQRKDCTPFEIPLDEYDRQLGLVNPEAKTRDSVCISVWRIGGKKLRYSRLASVIIPFSPAPSDKRFYVSHTSDAIYYLGFDRESGDTNLVLVYLATLKFSVFNLSNSEIYPKLSHLANSSLIYSNNVIVLNDLTKKSKDALSGDYVAIDIYTDEILWRIKDVERVFFTGLNLSACPYADDPQKNGAELRSGAADWDDGTADGETTFQSKVDAGLIFGPERILVHVLDLADQNKEEEKKQDDAANTNNKLYYLFFKADWDSLANNVDYQLDENLVWQHFELTGLSEATVAQQMKLSTARPSASAKRSFAKQIDEPVVEDEDTPSGKEEKPSCIYANDCRLSEIVLIFMGNDGQQHRILQFDENKQGVGKTSNRPGNCTIQLNQNSFLREIWCTFVILNPQQGSISQAKQLMPVAANMETSYPILQFLDADAGYAMDCWIEEDEQNGGISIQSICHSNSDDYLNCASVSFDSDYDSKDRVNANQVEKVYCRMKCQEIHMMYPCVASNVSSTLINVQSVNQPDVLYTLELDQCEFLCFTSYQSLEEIGFKDKRAKPIIARIPQNENGEFIVFLTKQKGQCDNPECNKGDIFLNVLHVDMFANKYVHWRTDYEACMLGGSRDDNIYKSYAIQVNSSRGVDVTLVNQYNDAIIFDCITSTKQKPIKFPFDYNNNEDEEDFEELAICRDATVLPVPMIKDKEGSLYFLVTDSKFQVKIIRVDEEAEMGNDDYFQIVYTFPSKWVYFFLIENSAGSEFFYLMDDSKRVRVLQQDPKSKMFTLNATLDLCRKDKDIIERRSFDEYAVSPTVLHWKDSFMTLIDNRTRDNPTWYSEPLMQKGYELVAGPKTPENSGLVYYVQHYATSLDQQMASQGQAQKMNNFQGQYMIVLMPKADLSFVECLPMAKVNNNNFFTFISADLLMAQYGGRFLIFDKDGRFRSEVQFEMPTYVKLSALKLQHFCIEKKYFVFEGREMKEPAKTDGMEFSLNRGTIEKKDDKKQPVKMCYYMFEFRQETKNLDQKVFTMYLLKISSDIQLPEDRQRTHTHVTPSGLIEQARIISVMPDPYGADKPQEPSQKYALTVYYSSGQAVAPKPSQDKFAKFSGSPNADEKLKTSPTIFTFTFTKPDTCNFQIQDLAEKISVLKAKRDKMLPAERKNFIFADELRRLQTRERSLFQVWKYGNYIIAKCGADVKYIKIDDPSKTQNTFNFRYDKKVWLQYVYQTGVDGLLQFYLINDTDHLIVCVTWNMEKNREHSFFETRYKVGQFAENLILQGFALPNQPNFNYCLEDGAVINLENNLPIQFFDKENEGDLVPHGQLKPTVFGQKKVSADQQSYLDLLVPGRIQKFISISDLIYWDRYQNDKTNHELYKNKVSSFAPISRFPNGLSLFHCYATNAQLLNTFANAYELERNTKKDDKRIDLFPLIVIHKEPSPGTKGIRQTPLSIAIEKNSQACFETMMSLISRHTQICTTGHILRQLKDIIDKPSAAVSELMSTSFRISNQIDGPKPLRWNGDQEELIIAVPSAYLCDEEIQRLIDEAQGTITSDATENEAEVLDDNQKIVALNENGLCNYEESKFEQLCATEDEVNNRKQVEVRLLDFDWLFTQNNAATLIKILAETANDEIFSCTQVRIFVDFMWNRYYQAIRNQLFIPYCVYFLSFVLYATSIGYHVGNTLDLGMVMELACLAIFGLGFVWFLWQEVAQLVQDPAGYFTSFWNLLDLCSLTMCGTYVFFEVTGVVTPVVNNVLGSVAVLLLWVKLFYWLRIYRAFSAFIRMVSEIVKDIQVFSVMLLICLAAFANCIIVLQKNREINGQDPIFDSYVGLEWANALIHAYLTGLGDFNKDYYSSGNSVTMWILFLGATVLVQLIFMNMLIALMSASFDRINGILEQSTLKELCIMMNDNIMLVNISKFFADKRYILWLSPGSQQAGGTLVERQINQLRQYVEERAMQSDNATNRQVNFINEKLNEVHTLVEKMSEPNEDQIERENNIEQQLTDLVNSNTKMNEVVDKLFAKMSPADAVEDVAKDVKKKAKSYFSSGFASLKNAVKDTVKDVDNLATAALTASASTVKKPEEDDSMFKQTYVSMAQATKASAQATFDQAMSMADMGLPLPGQTSSKTDAAKDAAKAAAEATKKAAEDMKNKAKNLFKF